MTTKEFIQYASERPELCEKMSACTAMEEVYAIAKKQGLTDDMATFTEVMTATKAEMEKLGENDLEKVNAALDTGQITIIRTAPIISAPMKDMI